MTITAWAGPLVSFGEDSFAPEQSVNPEQGPSLFDRGLGLLDPRQPYGYHPGQAFGSPTMGWLGTNRILTLFAPPVTKTAGMIAGSANIVDGTAMQLVSTAATGRAVGVSIVRADTGAAVTGLVEIDPLVVSCTANVTSGSNVLTVTATATGSGNHPRGISPGVVLTDVTTAGNIPTGTTISAYGTGNGGIGTYYMSANATATATGDTVTGQCTMFPHTINMGQAGTIRMWNPMALLSRAVCVTSTGNQVAGTVFTVRGYDVYGYPVTETITLSGTTATTTNGKKAFRYIQSVTPSVHSDAVNTYTIDTTDIFGLPLRSDIFQTGMEGDLSLMMNSAAITATTGYVAAVVTTPTAATGDVRGTYAVQSASDGTKILGVTQSPFNQNFQSIVGLYGQTQYADF